MRHNFSSTRHPRRTQAAWCRVGIIPAVIGAVALLAAACGGAASAPPAHLTAYQRELAYAECMRAHGLPTFPDPQNDGTFVSTRANASDFHGTLFLSANKVCAHLEGPGLTPAQQQLRTNQALKFAACMRARGVTEFQYSAPRDGHSAALGAPAGSPGADPGSPVFQSAQRACQKLAPGGL
jgi:hypothetical protein